MSRKVASLAVHRNTVERRRKSDVAHDLTRKIGKMVRERDIRAYAVVGIGADGMAYTFWDTGSVMPMWGFPSTIEAILRADMRDSGVAEDWRPPLAPKP